MSQVGTVTSSARRKHMKDVREKALKAWKREWKIRLAEENNPDWRDMSGVIL
ncbi:putative GIY-YIG superfamily endonuclease [Sphingobium sp. OAS761]|nr:putative GIY-YIG superfamily endonuclease [Sphingobium sp. OAS761]